MTDDPTSEDETPQIIAPAPPISLRNSASPALSRAPDDPPRPGGGGPLSKSAPYVPQLAGRGNGLAAPPSRSNAQTVSRGTARVSRQSPTQSLFVALICSLRRLCLQFQQMGAILHPQQLRSPLLVMASRRPCRPFPLCALEPHAPQLRLPFHRSHFVGPILIYLVWAL